MRSEYSVRSALAVVFQVRLSAGWAALPEPEAALPAILADFKVAEAPVIMRERQGGVSSIHSFKSVYYMIKVSLALIIDRLSIRKSKEGRA